MYIRLPVGNIALFSYQTRPTLYNRMHRLSLSYLVADSRPAKIKLTNSCIQSCPGHPLGPMCRVFHFYFFFLFNKDKTFLHIVRTHWFSCLEAEILYNSDPKNSSDLAIAGKPDYFFSFLGNCRPSWPKNKVPTVIFGVLKVEHEIILYPEN